MSCAEKMPAPVVRPTKISKLGRFLVKSWFLVPPVIGAVAGPFVVHDVHDAHIKDYRSSVSFDKGSLNSGQYVDYYSNQLAKDKSALQNEEALTVPNQILEGTLGGFVAGGLSDVALGGVFMLAVCVGLGMEPSTANYNRHYSAPPDDTTL